jgi:hypothetical protein
MLNTSSIEKFVLTPPTFTVAEAGRGNPFFSAPKSVLVPPISYVQFKIEKERGGETNHNNSIL